MRELRHVAQGILVGFLLVGLMAGYWSVLRSDGLRQRADNPRRIVAERLIERGSIYDHNGLLLAETTLNYNSTALKRLYPHPEVAPVVGYYSQRYGVSGIEASTDPILRGEVGPSPLQIAWRDLRHDPIVGGDVRLTLDLIVQKAALEALGGYAGAVVAVSVPDGAIRVMASAPSYDPNVIDENWAVLIQSEAGPLLNRVTQGVYQPGGALQTALLAAALAKRLPVNELLEAADAPVSINGIELTCQSIPPESSLSLAEAYSYGCPAPFARLLDNLEPADVDNALQRFGLLSPPSLLGLETDTPPPSESLAMQTDTTRLIAALAGQSDLAVSPLQLLELLAAIAGDGNAPILHLVEAVRPFGSAGWQAVPRQGLSRALLTEQNARRMRALMATPQGDTRTILAGFDAPIIGHAATAYSGPDAQLLQWFLGITELADGSAIAVVVVVEGADSPAVAARVGGATLDAAVRRHASYNNNAPAPVSRNRGVQ